jgi:hypothetical protein
MPDAIASKTKDTQQPCQQKSATDRHFLRWQERVIFLLLVTGVCHRQFESLLAAAGFSLQPPTSGSDGSAVVDWVMEIKTYALHQSRE